MPAWHGLAVAIVDECFIKRKGLKPYTLSQRL
jgi:hypothetical protein